MPLLNQHPCIPIIGVISGDTDFLEILWGAGFSGDTDFLEILWGAGFSGRVHSVFDRVINIESSLGDLWTIASREFDNAPNTLVVDAAELACFEIGVGERCIGPAQGELLVGSKMRLLSKSATNWNSPVTKYPQNDAVLRRNLRRIELLLATGGIGVECLAVHANSIAFLKSAHDLLEEETARLESALSDGYFETAVESAIRVVGLGPGLTPSGDDYLTGLFAVLHIAGSPYSSFHALCDAVITKADGMTNAISFAMLRMAAQGRVRESISLLLKDLMYGTYERLDASLSRVLAIGSTSGRDIVSGIMSGFRLNLGRARTA